MYLARAIHFDESDMNVFHKPARTGEWAISGGFEFSNWSDGDLVGKARQAFANGWLGIETFGQPLRRSLWRPLKRGRLDRRTRRDTAYGRSVRRP